MQCPLCETVVADSDVACPGCDEMLSDWRVLQGNSEILRERGLHLAARGDLVGACLSFMQAALSDPADTASLVDAGRSLLLLERIEDAIRILEAAHQRSRQSGAGELLSSLKKRLAAEAEAAGEGEKTTEGPTAPDESRGTAKVRSRGPAGQATRRGAPLLGLHPMTRKKGLLSRGLDPLWLSILHTERHWDDQWGSCHGWLTAACDVETPHPALLYLRGLDAWQNGQAREALTQFAQCLAQEQTVLNPVAWTMYAALMTNTSVDQVTELAARQVGEKGVLLAVDALSARLEQIGSEQSRNALRRLRNLER